MADIIDLLKKGGFLDISPSLSGHIAINEELYEIQPGDTIWGICDKYDIDMEELLKLNPWLASRFSEDKAFALIRPGEKLLLPRGEEFTCDSNFNDKFDAATTAPAIIYDPILVDLNGDGIKTTSVENGVYFDHQKDGFAERSAWVDEDDGVLVMDKNGDGIINDGSEVFGDNYVKSNGKKATSGFDALRLLNKNNENALQKVS